MSENIDNLSKITGKKGENLYNYLKKLAISDKNNSYLDDFRGALSLWAEYTNDVKSRVIVTLDGRDTAGKGSNIRKITEYFDTKRFDINAYGVPTREEKEGNNWFRRYENDFPELGKVGFFDRSWYNRALVEPAMSFCSEEEYNWFISNVSKFEKDQIIDKGIDFIKIYLSITKLTQKSRLEERNDEMKAWKSSFVDKQAQVKRNYYTLAKAKVLELTDSEHAPWTILDSNKRFLSSVEIIKMIIKTNIEIANIVENKLSIDLSPNKEVSRTANEELKRMKERGDMDKMKKSFNFDLKKSEEKYAIEKGLIFGILFLLLIFNLFNNF